MNLPLSRPSTFLMGFSPLELLTFRLPQTHFALPVSTETVPAPAQFIPCQGHTEFAIIVKIHLINVLNGKKIDIMSSWSEFVDFEGLG